MHIRDAAPDDLPAIQRIYAHHVLHGVGSFEETPPSLETMLARFNLVKSRGLPWLVAQVNGDIAGYSYADLHRERSAYRFTLEDAVYIAPGHARGGLGRALLHEILARSRTGGYRQMIAVIGDSQNHGSIGLHTALGFRPIGTLHSVGFKFGRWLDSVIMQKDLQDDETA
ncbi:MAG: N-acetyltransferase family protein [Beijerinckiaceae bacterium]|nr:N-acetyltransferase family protein [Beijerinckiaceae bacterium]